MAIDLKKEIKEIAQVAQSCPEEFRLKCFEMLLNEILTRTGAGEPKELLKEVSSVPGGKRAFEAFCKEYSLTPKALSDVFDFTSKEDFVLVSDFKQSTKAKQQVVIGLLNGIANLQRTGLATIEDKEFRKQCVKHKIYDQANFAQNMRKNKKYFNPTTEGGWKLTPTGLKKAAEIINALSGEGATYKL